MVFRALILLSFILFCAEANAQECNTPCGYCNCEEVEGNDVPPAPIGGYLLGAVVGIMAGLYFMNVKDKK